jgi:pimeloyl-ACP methyl ester carboxylesterase
MIPDLPKLDDREEHFFIEGPNDGAKLFLRHLAAPASFERRRRAVLYIHGATFPSALSIAHRFDGASWRDALHGAGFDVWGLDFQGFGHSQRYAAMNGDVPGPGPLCDAADAARQIDTAVRFILRHAGLPNLSLISHSWGSIPTGRFVTAHSILIDRWVLFGPIVRRLPAAPTQPATLPAWRIVSVEDQWRRFVEDVPPDEPAVLLRRHFDDWAGRWLDTDSNSRLRSPAAVKIPAGPGADIVQAHNGVLGYRPADVRVPIAIIRGEWDSLVTDADARWLFDAFRSAPAKRDIKISHGTHLLHLETMRTALYSETNAFLLDSHVSAQPLAA